MNEPVHQTCFECENCGHEGYVQSVGEPCFCPICGDKVEHDLIEFTLVEGGEMPVKEVVKTKIVYRNRPTKALPTEGRRGVRHIPGHRIVNDPPKISSVLKKGKRREYTVDCGYTGLRTVIISHLVTWHKMTLTEAREAVKVGNHDAVTLDEPQLCDDPEAKTVTGALLGYKLDPGEVRRYRFKLSCGYEGLRSSCLKHMCVHHEYSREDARDVINIHRGNVDTTNQDVRLDDL